MDGETQKAAAVESGAVQSGRSWGWRSGVLECPLGSREAQQGPDDNCNRDRLRRLSQVATDLLDVTPQCFAPTRAPSWKSRLLCAA